MPSPFPGMDPFLEHPAIFPDVHDRLITYLSEFLQARLPAPYYAPIGRRIWVEFAARYTGPDVQVLRPRHDVSPRDAGGGGAAVAVRDETDVVVVRVPHDERREPFVEIYTGKGADRRLVAAIELLSPTNKTPGDHGRDLYLRKQQEMLEGQVHLVEIDLLRGGEHTTAAPRDAVIAAAGRFDYHVSIHRFDRPDEYRVYPVRMECKLPIIRIPLLPKDGTVEIDLQAVFDRCYDAGPYPREIRYLEDQPVPPLPPEQAAWVAERLREAFPGAGAAV